MELPLTMCKNNSQDIADLDVCVRINFLAVCLMREQHAVNGDFCNHR